MRQLKYTDKLRAFHNLPLFTCKDAEKQGIPRQVLSHMEKKGDLEKIYSGAYRFADYEPQLEFQWENLGLIASSIPLGIICLVSALSFHELTDEVMREVWICVPHNTHPPVRPNTRIVRMRNSELGKQTINMGEYEVRIFNKERCVVDAFRYLSKEIAIKALRKYLEGGTHKPNLKKLDAYAKELRVNITPYILSCTT